jgi:hypothetical protein
VETYRRFAGLIDVIGRSRFTTFVLPLHLLGLWGLLGLVGLLCGLGCGAAPHDAAKPATTTQATDLPVTAAPAPTAPRAPDPDLHRPPPRRVLDIDWTKVALTDDASAIALWRRIAPTGADWDDKLQEIPASLARPLAIALLRGGNLTCARPPAGSCAKPAYDVPRPADTADFDDPCLRRLLALWGIERLDESDRPAVMLALLAIAAIPPPESQLHDAAIHAIPRDDHDARLALLGVAWRAGQHELVDAAVSALDEPHLIAAARQHHIGSALDMLAAAMHRELFLSAIADEALATRSRTAAIAELIENDGKLAPDLQAVLVAATRAKDCTVAATAARALAQQGQPRYLPSRPRTRDLGSLMRAMCVLASYEGLQRSDEPSLLASYLPPRGLERVTIAYDALSEVDSDGDGDPHTTRTVEQLARGDAVLPETETLVRAMKHCTGAICVSDDYEVRFVWKPAGGELLLSRIEIADRPPCIPAKP